MNRRDDGAASRLLPPPAHTSPSSREHYDALDTGARGTGPFENDDALDFLAEVETRGLGDEWRASVDAIRRELAGELP